MAGAAHHAGTPGFPPFSPNITQRPVQIPSPTDSRCPTLRSHSNKKTRVEPHTCTTGSGQRPGPKKTLLDTWQPTYPPPWTLSCELRQAKVNSLRVPLYRQIPLYPLPLPIFGKTGLTYVQYSAQPPSPTLDAPL